MWVTADSFYIIFKELAENVDSGYTMIPSRALPIHCRAVDLTILKVHRHGQGAKALPSLQAAIAG